MYLLSRPKVFPNTWVVQLGAFEPGGAGALSTESMYAWTMALTALSTSSKWVRASARAISLGGAGSGCTQSFPSPTLGPMRYTGSRPGTAGSPPVSLGWVTTVTGRSG